MEIKNQYFAGGESEGLEPKCGIVSVADGTPKGIGDLIAASVCHGGPGPGFLAPWIYKYIACGLQKVLKDFPQALSTGSLYCHIYKKVSHTINSMLNFLLNFFEVALKLNLILLWIYSSKFENTSVIFDILGWVYCNKMKFNGIFLL